ncbi:MAG: hypothetical protein AB1894_23890 [Chloroflexota bacterium]
MKILDNNTTAHYKHEQPGFFNASMGDGAIGAALAPLFRPDPCAP